MAPGPWWAQLTIWVVVNLVCLLQAAGFLTRRAHGMAVNHVLGLVMAVLAVPAAVAGVGLALGGSPWWVGPAAYVAFVCLMLVVDYVRPVEFRSPSRPMILVPYLVLFFGAIVLMGIPMFTAERALWAVTVVTATALVASMASVARREGA